MTKVIFTAFILLLSLNTSAQKIKLKKGEVLLDGKAILKYEKEMWGTHKIHLFSLDSEDELIEINNNKNETPTYQNDDFVQIKFLKIGESVEMKTNKPFYKMIEWLVEKKIISTDGKINEENIELFIKNYDENITNRTVRN